MSFTSPNVVRHDHARLRDREAGCLGLPEARQDGWILVAVMPGRDLDEVEGKLADPPLLAPARDEGLLFLGIERLGVIRLALVPDRPRIP